MGSAKAICVKIISPKEKSAADSATLFI